MRTSLAVLFLFISASVFAGDSILTPPSKGSSGCDLWTHFEVSDKQVFLSFFSKLQEAIKDENKEAVKGLVNFPLKINSKPKRVIQNSKELLISYDTVFTKKIKSVILNQDKKKFFCKSTGLMLGGGQVWINNFNKKEEFRIISINP